MMHENKIIAALTTLSQSCAVNVLEWVTFKTMTSEDMMVLRDWKKDVAYTSQMRDQSIFIETHNFSLIDGVYDKLEKKTRT